ncbi:MAG: hypothetical protein AB2A00_12820 [Myxococcota bacterium]
MANLHRVYLGMRAITVPVLLGAVLLGGCGNWSNDDILFKLAAPDRNTLRLRVPGAEVFEEQAANSTAQGLGNPCEGDEADNITCGIRQIAGFFNAFTFGLLGVVDNITSNDPTKREQGLRVWGPHFVQDKNFTARFEMRREEATGGFSYCLHVAGGNRTGPFADRDVRCGRDASGFIEIFTGDFVPEEGAEPQARKGVGHMVLNLNTQRRTGTADDPKAQGKFIFDYDTTGGATVIAITVEDFNDEDTGLPARATYSYRRTDAGDGEIHLRLLKQLRCGEFFGCNGSDRETLDLGARWTAEGASRVDAVGSGGDLDREYRGWECAQSDLRIVARHYDWEPDKDLGSESLCPFSAVDVSPNDSAP